MKHSEKLESKVKGVGAKISGGKRERLGGSRL